MPTEFRKTLRTYFHYGKRVRRYLDQLHIVDQMSPMLQGKVSMHLHNPWLAKVWYLQGLPTDAVVAIARELEVEVLAPQEEVRFGSRKLYIVRRGVCVVGVRVKSSGEMWGEDMILHNVHLRENVLTRALGYMDIVTLEFHRLIEAVESSANPQESLQKIHWARAFMALRRGMVKIALALKNWEFRTGMSTKRITKESLHVLIHQAVNGQDLDGNPVDLGSVLAGDEEPEFVEDVQDWEEEQPHMPGERLSMTSPPHDLGSAAVRLMPNGLPHGRRSSRTSWRHVSSLMSDGPGTNGTRQEFADGASLKGKPTFSASAEDKLARLIDGKLSHFKKYLDARLDEKLGVISC